MDIQLKSSPAGFRNLKKVLFFVFLVLFAQCVEAKDWLKEAYIDATGYTHSQLSRERAEDTQFATVDPFCCCSSKILEIFKEDTRTISEKLNPATDKFIASLSAIKESNELIREKIKNLKQINGMLSFSDTGEYQASLETPEGFSELPGCVPIDFNSPEDRATYLEIIDKMEAGGSYTREGERSSAYGRYQFMPDTAAEYCTRVPAGMECCDDAWKSSPQCQDEMFLSFTADNIASATPSTPINSCTIYLMHQQGVSGFNWIMGGDNPYSSFEKLQLVVEKNVDSHTWETAEASGQTATEEGLRQIMREYWGKKFGGDITADVGDKAESIEAFTEGVHHLSEEVDAMREARRQMLRKGILLEIKKENWDIEVIKNAYDLKNSSKQIQIQKITK
ncbi:MAG TPA: hypothetical protein ENN12_00785 [Epsilonproteobacteria bacterium]|nr:hypothetical protein [Campylobacterota bacterium]